MTCEYHAEILRWSLRTLGWFLFFGSPVDLLSHLKQRFSWLGLAIIESSNMQACDHSFDIGLLNKPSCIPFLKQKNSSRRLSEPYYHVDDYNIVLFVKHIQLIDVSQKLWCFQTKIASPVRCINAALVVLVCLSSSMQGAHSYSHFHLTTFVFTIKPTAKWTSFWHSVEDLHQDD